MSRFTSDRETSGAKNDFTSDRSRSNGNNSERVGFALLEACLLGRIGFVDILLELGASVHARSADGDTPLILAAVQGSSAVVNRLLDKGSDIEARNGHGLTALMEAAFWGNTEVVKTLVERGADVHAVDCKGRTAFDWAGEEERHEVVDLLAAVQESSSADPPHSSDSGLSPRNGEAHRSDLCEISQEGVSRGGCMPAALKDPEAPSPLPTTDCVPRAAGEAREESGL